MKKEKFSIYINAKAHFSKALIAILFLSFSSICIAESTVFYDLSSKSKKTQPEYENCQDVDLSSLDLEKESGSRSDTEGEFCFTCSVRKIFGFGEIKETALAVQSKAFKEKLQKRVIGQIESKIFQTKVLRACATGDRNWLSRQKVDWPLMKALCEKKTKELKSSIKTRWPEMRTNLALSQVRFDRLVNINKHLFSVPPVHKISGFSSLPNLTEREEQGARKKLSEGLSSVPLDKFNPSEIKDIILQGKPFFQGGKSLTTKDYRQLRKATRNLGKKSQERYFEVLSEMPILGYLETGNPKKKELDEAFAKMEENLKDFLKKAKDSEADMGLLLSFKPLVEELLKEDNGYCLVAEGARIEAEKDESLKNWMMLGTGVVAAVPCFISGPVGATACLTAGMAIGVWGYKEAQMAKEASLGRALTGKQFETMAGLNEREKEEF